MRKLPAGLGFLTVLALWPAGADAASQLSYKVLTPPGYAGSGLRYPVVYLIPGSGATPAGAVRTLGLEGYVQRGRAIVVVVSEVGDGESNFIVNWADGSKPLDSEFVGAVMPAVDAAYRTLATPASRAIVGYSAGGYSALALASRHPGLFATVASFSGIDDLQWDGTGGELAFESVNAFFYGPGTIFRRWGDPLNDSANWAAQNPGSLVSRLRGKPGIYISAGNGLPASQAEASAAGASLPQEMAQESLVAQMAHSYDRKLTSAGVAHAVRFHTGMHDASNWRADLARWWPTALTIITPPPMTPPANRPNRTGGHKRRAHRCRTSRSRRSCRSVRKQHA
jgi:S-formylglutathione hydrolase FrmB